MYQQGTEYLQKHGEASIAEMTRRLFADGRKEMVDKKRQRRRALNEIETSNAIQDGNSFLSKNSANDTDSVCPSCSTDENCDIRIRLKDLSVIRKLGSGTSGYVKEVIHIPSNTVMAIKVVAMSSEAVTKESLCRELNCLRYSDSPYFIEFYGATSFGGSQLLILMEYMDLGSLDSVQEKLGGTISERILGKVGESILYGLQFMHKRLNMLHRDIKPANILMNSHGEVKLTDFGVSGYMDETGKIRTSWSGTTSYMSPERVSGEPYDESSDIWSVALTLYYCATGVFPFVDDNNSIGFWELFFRIKNNDVPNLPNTFSVEFDNFIQICMCKDPKLRPSVDQLLQHPFIQMYHDVDLYVELNDIICVAKENNARDVANVSTEPVVQSVDNSSEQSPHTSVNELSECPDLLVVRPVHVDGYDGASQRLDPIPENELYSLSDEGPFTREQTVIPADVISPIATSGETKPARMLALSMFSQREASGEATTNALQLESVLTPRGLRQIRAGESSNPLDDDVTIEEETEIDDPIDSRRQSWQLPTLYSTLNYSDDEMMSSTMDTLKPGYYLRNDAMSSLISSQSLTDNKDFFSFEQDVSPQEPSESRINMVSLESFLAHEGVDETEWNEDPLDHRASGSSDNLSILNMAESVRSCDDGSSVCDSVLIDMNMQLGTTRLTTIDGKQHVMEPRHHILLVDQEEDMDEVSEGEEGEVGFNHGGLHIAPLQIGSSGFENVHIMPRPSRFVSQFDATESMVIDLSRNSVTDLSIFGDTQEPQRITDDTDDCYDLDADDGVCRFESVSDGGSDMDVENPSFVDPKRSSEIKLMHMIQLTRDLTTILTSPPIVRPPPRTWTQAFIRRWNAMVHHVRDYFAVKKMKKSQRRQESSSPAEVEMTEIGGIFDAPSNVSVPVSEPVRGCFRCSLIRKL